MKSVRTAGCYESSNKNFVRNAVILITGFLHVKRGLLAVFP